MLLDLLGRAGVERSDTPPVNHGGHAGPALPGREDFACEQQWLYTQSTAKFNAVGCSRRAGKTNGAWRRGRAMLARPRTWTHYASLIRRNAWKQFFMPLVANLNALGWPVKVNHSNMLIETAWGSYLQAFSVPDIGAVSSVKGDRSDLFMLDECQEPADDVIEALIDVAALPMTVDTGGMVDLLGTVPEVEPCFFSKALDSAEWAQFHWTMFDHDLPRSAESKRAEVDDILRRRGLTWESPIAQREYLGKRVKDASKFVYDFNEARNTYTPAELQELAGGRIYRAA